MFWKMIPEDGRITGFKVLCLMGLGFASYVHIKLHQLSDCLFVLVAIGIFSLFCSIIVILYLYLMDIKVPSQKVQQTI